VGEFDSRIGISPILLFLRLSPSLEAHVVLPVHDTGLKLLGGRIGTGAAMESKYVFAFLSTPPSPSAVPLARPRISAAASCPLVFISFWEDLLLGAALDLRPNAPTDLAR
jgi:hypothetical protein